MSGPIITDKQYQEMFQIGVTPEMLGVKEMSVEELIFNLEDDVGFLTFKFDGKFKLFDSSVSSTEVYAFNRFEAHLIMLYLQEYLK